MGSFTGSGTTGYLPMRLRARIDLSIIELQIWTLKLRYLWRVAPIAMAQARAIQEAMAKIPPGRN